MGQRCDLTFCQNNQQEELIHAQGKKIQEQGEVIDELNTQLADVSSSLAERLAKLEDIIRRQSDSINALNRCSLKLHDGADMGVRNLEVMERMYVSLEAKVASLEVQVCRCQEDSSDTVSASLVIYCAGLITAVGGGDERA